jgi:metal-sulfur cluster biosynthetic enzyme
MNVPRERLLDALREVADPCSIAMRASMDIVEMGLIGDLRIEGGNVIVELVLTDPSCAHFRGLESYIGDVLKTFDGVESVKVVHSTAVLWTPDRVNRRPSR